MIRKLGPCKLRWGRRESFDVLVSSVVSQQLSGKAASTIKRRLIERAGSPRSLAPALTKLTVDELRACGLSATKAATLLNLANLVVNKELNLATLKKATDEEVYRKLTAVKGIGNWTVQMFLIFGLRRPDVFSVGDAGLRRGIQILYRLEDRPTEDEMLAITEKWRPYRSVGAWYLWRMLD